MNKFTKPVKFRFSKPLQKTPQDQLFEVSQLNYGWDGYNAQPIEPTCIELVKQIFKYSDDIDAPLRDLHIAPTQHGGMQLEWEFDTYSLELEIDEDEIALLIVPKTNGKVDFDSQGCLEIHIPISAIKKIV